MKCILCHAAQQSKGASMTSFGCELIAGPHALQTRGAACYLEYTPYHDMFPYYGKIVLVDGDHMSTGAI
eukprot:1161127-Pelagomonas_calceolata.AAC.14